MLQNRKKTMPGSFINGAMNLHDYLNNITAINTNAFTLHVVLFAVQDCCNPVYFKRRPEKKASHDDLASCNCGQHKAISLGRKNFQQASIYASNLTQHYMRCHPQTVHCQIHNNSVYALNSEVTHVTFMVCMHL
jgi:hypothetical protein